MVEQYASNSKCQKNDTHDNTNPLVKGTVEVEKGSLSFGCPSMAEGLMHSVIRVVNVLFFLYIEGMLLSRISCFFVDLIQVRTKMHRVNV